MSISRIPGIVKRIRDQVTIVSIRIWWDQAHRLIVSIRRRLIGACSWKQVRGHRAQQPTMALKIATIAFATPSIRTRIMTQLVGHILDQARMKLILRRIRNLGRPNRPSSRIMASSRRECHLCWMTILRQVHTKINTSKPKGDGHRSSLIRVQEWAKFIESYQDRRITKSITSRLWRGTSHSALPGLSINSSSTILFRLQEIQDLQIIIIWSIKWRTRKLDTRFNGQTDQRLTTRIRDLAIIASMSIQSGVRLLRLRLSWIKSTGWSTLWTNRRLVRTS